MQGFSVFKDSGVLKTSFDKLARPLWSKRPSLNLQEAGTHLKSLGKSFRDSMKEEQRRYKTYYESLKASISKRFESPGPLGSQPSTLGKRCLEQLYWARGMAAYHLKHTPIYLFKLGVFGGRFGWQAVKVVGRTKPGGAFLTCVVLYNGAQPLYVFGTRRTEEVYVVKVFQRNDFSETDGLTGYLFTDERGDNYRVVGSWFYAQFFPVELWTPIEIDKPYKIVCYGIRFPPLKIWPNVVRMVPLENRGDYRKEVEAKRENHVERLKDGVEKGKEGALLAKKKSQEGFQQLRAWLDQLWNE